MAEQHQPTHQLSEDWRVSIESCIAFSSRDWSLHHRDAWLYGIIFGYGPEALIEMRMKHGWDDGTIARLEVLRRQYKEEKDQAALREYLKQTMRQHRQQQENQ